MQLDHGGSGVPKTLSHNGFRSGIGVIEQRLAGGPVHTGHHEERWHVGRVARLLEQHLGNRYGCRRERPDGAGLP
jgi:hypothetical protein